MKYKSVRGYEKRIYLSQSCIRKTPPLHYWLLKIDSSLFIYFENTSTYENIA